MRIVLIWPMSDPAVKILLDELRAAGHEVVYWVGEQSAAHLAPAGCIFHDHYDAWDAKPAQALAQNIFLPPSAEVIGTLYELESLILTMMNKRYDAAPVDERKHIYYTMLGYWNYVLATVKPDVVIYNTIPHSIYSNIVYELAKSKNILTLSFEETWVAGRLMLYSDFWHGSDQFRAVMRAMRERGAARSDLGPEFRDYYDLQKKPKARIVPWYMHEQRSNASGIGLWLHRARIALRSPHRIIERAAGLFARSMRSNLKKEYVPLVRTADMSQAFVYFPLNFQPERTTSPQGGIFHDQILAAETLAAALPEGWELYVKEHPSQWWLRGKTRFSSARYPGYYARIAKIPRVRLVPILTDTFALTENAKVVATINGTAGWEALLRGKHVLAFGIPWYRDCPGIFRVQSVKDCSAAFSVVQTSRGVPESDVLGFLAALEKTGTRANVGSSGSAIPVISPEDSMRAVAERLSRELAEFVDEPARSL